MTRKVRIKREIEATIKLRDEIYAEINRVDQSKMESSWFEARLTDIDLLDMVLDDLTAALNVSILV